MKLSFAALLAILPLVHSQGYGPLSPVADDVTGLYLLELPEGFSYKSYGWTGQVSGNQQGM